jgi:hypothetical protein
MTSILQVLTKPLKTNSWWLWLLSLYVSLIRKEIANNFLFRRRFFKNIIFFIFEQLC